MKLIELQFVFKVLNADASEVVINFNSSQREAVCRTLTCSGKFKERVFPILEEPSLEYAGKLVREFLGGLG